MFCSLINALTVALYSRDVEMYPIYYPYSFNPTQNLPLLLINSPQPWTVALCLLYKNHTSACLYIYNVSRAITVLMNVKKPSSFVTFTSIYYLLIHMDYINDMLKFAF